MIKNENMIVREFLFLYYLNKFSFVVISESIAAVVNGNSSPVKRPRPIPAKKPLNSLEDETRVEIRTTGLTLADLLSRSSSSLESEVRSCLNDLCQRVVFLLEQSSSDMYNQLPSPVFKRKMETQMNMKDDEQSEKRKFDSLIRKKSLTDLLENKEETIEQESTDIKPIVSTITLDYSCEWENCRA